jgi:hypothetical protein
MVRLRQPSGLDLAQDVLARSIDDEVMRSPFPLFAEAEVQARHLASVERNLFSRIGRPGFLLGYLRELHARVPTRTAFASRPGITAAPRIINEDVAIKTLSRFPLVIEHLEEKDGIEVYCAGERFQMSEEAVPLLRSLRVDRPIAFGALVDQFGDLVSIENLRTILSELVAHGVIAIVSLSRQGDATDHGSEETSGE